MKSLRTRRSTPSTAPQRPKQKLSKGSKDARKSRVDDKMKRRMSARYADISDPRDAEVPDMPDLRDLRRIAQGGAPAKTFYDEDEDDVGVPAEEARVDVLDVRDLEQEEFDPDAYLRSKLASSTEAELRAFQASLQTTKDATALDLQKNVFKNYSDFVVISKEISTLENDMLELKASLQEWKSMPSLLALDPSTSTAAGESANVTDTRRRTARSSIADLRTLYISQLQTLHSTIEGSVTLVPTIPGRHIIAEASDLQQLNAATYRPEHGAHIVLLDDSLLVARRRRGRLVADRAWQLGEISLVDVRDTSELQNVFKIKRGQDTFVYRTERLSDKRALLSQFRKAAEELAARKRKEREGEHEKRRSLWVAGDRKSLVLDAMPALPAWMAEMAAGSAGAAAKAEQDERWINNFIDELTVAVALRDWDSAVNLVVKGQGRTAMVPGLSSKLTPLAEQLTAELLGALADPAQRRSSTVKVVAYIVRLGPDALVRARDTFLNSRATLMRKRVRAIRFEGDVRAYIKELALIVFTSVKHTADWYLASFKDFEMASGLIRWAKEQVEDFAKMFCVQVYGSETNAYDQAQVIEDTTLAQECIQIAKNQNRRLLRDIGMDFSFILLDLISLPTPPSEIKTHMWPYEFEVWKNVSGKNDERLQLQNVQATPIFWDNNQPVGTFVRFHIKDAKNFVSGSDFIRVEPDPAISISSVSMISTASAASVRSTATITTTSTTPSITTTRTSATMRLATASPGPTTLQTNTGAIAGGVVGGVLLLAAITTALILLLRRRGSKSRKENIDILGQSVSATPFIYEGPYHARANQPQRYDDPSQPYQGAGDAPPIYSPPPTSQNLPSTGAPSANGTSSVTRGATRKGAYTPVSTVPH
ncbi:exocyst complex component exo84 [Ceratobasidium sp. 423]|nr:exocyst complex component exo84 [Ceratobasidium sp. 423]